MIRTLPNEADKVDIGIDLDALFSKKKAKK
jgi:hypothetical protein